MSDDEFELQRDYYGGEGGDGDDGDDDNYDEPRDDYDENEAGYDYGYRDDSDDEPKDDDEPDYDRDDDDDEPNYDRDDEPREEEPNYDRGDDDDLKKEETKDDDDDEEEDEKEEEPELVASIKAIERTSKGLVDADRFSLKSNIQDKVKSLSNHGYDIDIRLITDRVDNNSQEYNNKYWNALALVLGFIVTNGGRDIDKTKFEEIINNVLKLPDYEEESVYPADVIRYARLWQTQLRL